MKKALITLVLLGLGISVYAYYNMRHVEFVPAVTTVTVSRGLITDTVGATGTLEAVTTVQVGSQVSGIIKNLYADFNSIVRQGEIIARLDPSLFETQIEQARANLLRAEADVERQRVAGDDAKATLTRAEGLAERNLIPETELEASQMAVRSAQAQLKSSEAQVTQARASLNQNQVNLEHTVITAPIDGIVISRAVDVGQTVAASMTAPELFVLAADLTKMRVIANIDEADVGRVRPGQPATFTVDAYAADQFQGTVSQIRLAPVVIQNVVTYAAVIDVPNPDLRLKPGMTATVTLEIARRDDTIRIPNSALRFRPTPDMFVGLNQPVPEALQGGRPDGSPTDGFAGDREDPERRRQMIERMQNMSPEESERFARGLGGARGGRGPDSQSRRPAEANQQPTVPTVERGARTIDALFGPLPPTVSTARVWLYDGHQMNPARVRLGITDGSYSELLSGDVESGTELVMDVSTESEGRSRASGGGPSSSPLIPQLPFGRGRRR